MNKDEFIENYSNELTNFELNEVMEYEMIYYFKPSNIKS